MTSNPDPTQQGYTAYSAGLGYNDNPYGVLRLSDRLLWATAWRRAAAEATERSVRNFNQTYEANARRRGQYDD